LTGYEGIYPNPQFFFMLFILPILLYARVFDFSRLKKYYLIFFLIFIIIIFYFFSSLIAVNTTSVEPINPLKESVRQSLNYLVLFFPFLFLKKDYLISSLKTLIVLGLFEIVFIIYGILGVFNIFPIANGLKKIISDQIYSQSWTIFGFIPKWAGTFEETQILSTFFLICFIVTDLLENIKGKNKFLKLIKILFGISIIYCFSKATVPAFLFYLIFRKLNNRNLYKYLLLTPLIILIVFFYPWLGMEKEIFQIINYQNLEELGLSHSSLGERLFHIINVLNFMSESFTKIFFGIGPRTYGTIISLKYPEVFNSNANCISVFTVLSDIGFLGFMVFLFFLFIIFKKIKSTKIKIAYLSLLIAYLPQISWGVSVVILGISVLLNYDSLQKNKAKIENSNLIKIKKEELKEKNYLY